ncbi:MAG: DUF488 domain-containing protein [Caldilineaceae bacterium]|nr:DUF488 domain-containing protein [Caldilineaceae bacterium]
MSVSQTSKPDTTTIYTVGYGARTADELIALLHTYGIEYLIDVRSAPYSRYKPEFNRDALEAALKAQHIHYVFMGDALGGRPADPDCYVDGKVDYARVETKPFYQAGVTRLENAFAQGVRVALMCSEGKPEQCHRSKLIGATLTARGLPVTHIDENNAMLTQAEVVARLDGPQLALFDEPTRTSRKRYAPKEDGPAGGEEAPNG